MMKVKGVKMSAGKVIVISVIWIVSGAIAIVMKDVGVLGYALAGSFILYFLE